MASFAFGDTFYVLKCLLKFGECGMRLNAFVTVRISFSLERQGLIGIWLSAKELGGSCPSHYKSSHPTDRRHLHHLKKDTFFVQQIKNHLPRLYIDFPNQEKWLKFHQVLPPMCHRSRDTVLIVGNSWRVDSLGKVG